MESSKEASLFWERKKNDTEFADIVKDFNCLATHDRICIMQFAFHSHYRNHGLRLLPCLQQEELMALFSDLVFMSSYTHGGVVRIREAIKSLPRKWVLENIEDVAEPFLKNGDS